MQHGSSLSASTHTDEEDIVDSDFGKSSDEEAGAEDSEEEGERQLQAEEKAARKVRKPHTFSPFSSLILLLLP